MGLPMEVTNEWLRFIAWALNDIQIALLQIYNCYQSIGTALPSLLQPLPSRQMLAQFTSPTSVHGPLKLTDSAGQTRNRQLAQRGIL